MNRPPLFGLVLAGGRSRRMGRDKSGLEYGGTPQLARAVGLLEGRCSTCYVSVRDGQTDLPGGRDYRLIADEPGLEGPAAGLLTALRKHRDVAWLALACDLPLLDGPTVNALIEARDPARPFTAFASAHDGLPEPLCAIYEPAFLAPLEDFVRNGGLCPRKLLIRLGGPLLSLANPRALDNVNEPREYESARARLEGISIRVRYFAALREQAGCDGEAFTSTAADVAGLYGELAGLHGFTLPVDRVRAAIDGAYVPADTKLVANAEILLIPPVAGG